MDQLKNKTILILSPQAWGKMFISKHHYAIELVNAGNKVFFLNPPNDPKPGAEVHVRLSNIHPNLSFIEHKLRFPYNLKFHAMGLFHFLMKAHVKRILKKTGPVDIIWSFDLGNLYPFSLFPEKSVKVFHPVDEPTNKQAIDSAAGAQYIFSVTKEILEKYSGEPAPKHHIQHGVASYFIHGNTFMKPDNMVRVGISGNMLRADLDRPTLLRIIKDNPSVVFECWGSYRVDQTNIGGATDQATADFIEALQQQTNVVLHGVVAAEKLAGELNRMDAFLICYDVQKDQSKGTNYHKIIEYLGTGKVIISNNVTTYQGKPELLQMVESRDHNNELPVLFRNIIHGLEQYNAPELMTKRKQFAATNTYEQQVKRIEAIIYGAKA